MARIYLVVAKCVSNKDVYIEDVSDSSLVYMDLKHKRVYTTREEAMLII